MILAAPHLWKLFLAAASALMFSGFFVIAPYEDRLETKQSEKEIKQEAETLAASVSAVIAFQDRHGAAEYLDALATDPRIRSAVAYDRDGHVLASLSADRAKAAVAGKSSPRPNDANQTPLQMGFVMPVMRQGVKLGSIQLTATTDNWPARMARLTGIGFLSAMGILLFGVVAADRRTLTRTNSELTNVNTELRRRAQDLELANERVERETAKRLQAEEALHHSLKLEAIEQLSGGIAHDLTNYLAIITSSLAILKRRLVEGHPDYSRYIDSAEEGVQKASVLTRRMTVLAGRRQLSPQAVETGQLIENMLELIRRSVGESITVKTHLAARGQIFCDSGQLELVLLNLAINARDAMPTGGELAFATRDVRNSNDTADGASGTSAGEHVELTVRDTGCGMSDEVRAQALEPFFTTKPEGKGTGLGLSMAASFVQRSGGRLTIQSSTKSGTVIVMLFPRHVANTNDGIPLTSTLLAV